MDIKRIKVPKVSAGAYNAKRPASDLLRRQVAQLEHVVARVAGYGAVPTPAKKVKTEGQAAAFIAAVTRALQPNVAPPAAGTPVPEPPAPVAPPTKRRAPRRRPTKVRSRKPAKRSARGRR
jgi:hypothetical protein